MISSAAFAVVLGLSQQLAEGQTDDRYIGGTTGLWSTPANWSLGVPTTPTGSITTTSIINSDGVARTVTYDYNGPAVTIAPLTIDLTGGTTGAANSLVMAQGALSVEGGETIGVNGSGAFSQSGGANAVNGPLNIGVQAGTGFYSLSGGTLSAGDSTIEGANGIFNQSGGSSTFSGLEILGLNGGSGSFGQSGTFIINGGTCSVASDVLVGDEGEGAANVTVTRSGVLNVPGIELAPGAAISLNLSGGTLNVDTIQFDHSSQFNWTAGALNINSNVTFDPSGAATSAIFGPALTLGAGRTLQISGNETLGGAGQFSLTLNAGSNHVVTGNLYIPNTGTLTQNPGSTLDYSQLYLEGGTINGTLTNLTTFVYFSGAFNGRLVNQGSAQIEGNFSAPGGIENDGGMMIGGTTTQISIGGPGLDNYGTIQLTGGQFLTSTALINEASGDFAWGGTVTTPVTNFGFITIGQASAVLAGNPLTNYGIIEFDYTASLRNSGGIENQGTISLGYGTISGTAAVINDSQGLIESTLVTALNSPSGISAPLTNRGGVIQVDTGTILTLSDFNGGNINGGQIQIQPGGTLNSTLAFPSSGTIVLQGIGASLGGGAITNTGTISGVGRISSVVLNSGVVDAVGGELMLSAAGDTNPADGQLQAGAGSTVFFSQGLAVNNGTIALAGGTFDNNNVPITNHGNIVGNGTLRSGGLTNATDGTVLLTDAASSVYGAVTNAGSLRIVGNTTTFYGNVNNTGTIEVTSGVARFLGNGISMTVGGTYKSDPSDNYFNGLTVASTGSLSGGSGDRFFITGGATLTNAGTWNSNGLLSTAAIVNSGVFNQLGPLTQGGNFTNTGTTTLGGTQNWSSGTIFINNCGLAMLLTDLGAMGSAPAVYVYGGSVAFASTQHLSTLNIANGALVTLSGGGNGARSILFTTNLNLPGTLDLTGNDLDMQSGGPAGLATITASIAHGYDNGSWTGSGIASSSAANDSTRLSALGVILNTVNGNTPLYTSLDRATVAVNDVLIKYTYYGDANLDGKVDGSDYSGIDNGYLTHASGWFNGDFNYDGTINGSDYTLIDNAFNRQGVQLNSELATATSQWIDAAGSQVPEPCGTILLLSTGAGLLGRRDSKSSHSVRGST